MTNWRTFRLISSRKFQKLQATLEPAVPVWQRFETLRPLQRMVECARSQIGRLYSHLHGSTLSERTPIPRQLATYHRRDDGDNRQRARSRDSDPRPILGLETPRPRTPGERQWAPGHTEVYAKCEKQRRTRFTQWSTVQFRFSPCGIHLFSCLTPDSSGLHDLKFIPTRFLFMKHKQRADEGS